VASGFGKFTGNTLGEAAAFAAGIAIAPLLEPVVQELRNVTWSNAPDKPLDPETAAEAVAEGFLTTKTGAAEAAMSGIATTPFTTLIELARTAPGVAEAQTLMRRIDPATGAPAISTAQLHHAYAKAKIDPQYWGPLDVLLEAPLPPAVAALAAVRGLIDAEGFLPVDPPTERGVIAPFPVYPISGKEAAAAVGLSEDAYGVMVGINGRPMSLHEAASAYFREIIELPDYYRAVAEGDTRNEWRDAILDQARQIPTAHDFIEKRLRGWTDDAGMYDGTARHGMSEDDTATLFLIAGRPISQTQIFTGLARGGAYNGPTDDIDPAFLKGLQESNIRPEWYNLLWAGRFHFPPLFQLNNLVKAGAVDPDTAKQWVIWETYAPEVVDTLYTYWKGVYPAKGAGATPAKADPAVTAARSAAVTEIRKAFVAGGISELSARQDLSDLGVPDAAVDQVISDWNVIVAVGTQEADTAGGTPH
jgi:hypothetical protein